MKTLKQITQKGIAFVALAILFQSCVSVAPVTTSVESARLVKEGKIEGSVTYSNYKEKEYEYKTYIDGNGNYHIDKGEGSMQTMNNNYGMRIVVGGKKANIGFHYEKMVARDHEFTVNYFSIEPKFKIRDTPKSASAFSIPLGVYIPNEEDATPVYQLMPAFHFTFSGSKYFEFNFSPKMLFILNNFPSYPFLNMTAGFGFSSDLSKWAIRPEIGYSVYTGGKSSGILQTAVGLSFTF